ncbi:peptidoglycan DD-metalloendopeptidase family protein [Sphingomonas crusticola]|uniref:peptidoglycan DD-metalloendopeptidase family protein n=1 Tax=Sphingomonas crusticola TaxID=1697973 RepID=UPI000E289715
MIASTVAIRALRAFGLAAAAVMMLSQPVLAAGLPAPQRGDKIQPSGGPLLPASAAGDSRFHSLFLSWKKADAISSPGAISVPSSKPVQTATYTSGYGVRSDPFRGSAAMHAGIDLAAPMGTAVYATADGVVDRAEWSGGYGNLVEIDHGKGLQTRFGHLSRVLVHSGDRVVRGQLIALMGSTGRSTGSHLHYEVRIDGHAVNPVPFLQSADYVTAMEARTAAGLALGGPNDANDDQD